MDRMAAIGQHAVGQPAHAAADLAMEGALELAGAGLGFEGGDLRQEGRDRLRQRSSLEFELGDPGFQSFHALSELAHVISAVPR